LTTGEADDDRNRTLTITLTPDEALVLVNALNEVCNGIEIEDWEFATRLGADREEARALLGRLGRLVDEP
jgi:hypothetical protein